ncbi:MAG: hypothetical protein PHX83_07385 [Acidobacteriia bacterium]|nr:hypothetical protein [Terriglobia bacterium]
MNSIRTKKHWPRAPLSITCVFAILTAALSMDFSAQPHRIPTRAEMADRVRDTFDSLKVNPPAGKRLPPGTTVRISQDEMNAYVTEEFHKKPNPGLKSIFVRFLNGDQVAGDAVVDVDQLKTDNSTLLKLVTLVFSGDQAMHTEAKLFFNNNALTYEIQRAQLNNISLPAMLVQKIIEVLARKQTNKIDVSKPIPYSPTIKHIEIREGLLLIQT